MDAPPAPVVELEEMLMALKWDGPATGFFSNGSDRFGLLADLALSSPEGGLHDGLLKSSISTYLSLGIVFGNEYGW